MTIANVASVAALVVDLVALYFLVGIWRDDRAMRHAAEESLKAQLEYLGLRRKWYETRTKKKDNEKANIRPVDGTDTDSVQHPGGSD
jgi:hypothetical protein